jgi:LmbE family N-acetylglucosaminyl deacetylase
VRYPSVLLALLLFLSAARAQSEIAADLPLQARLERLGVLGSVLVIGAHDDDDDTFLLTYLSLGLHLRTGYLSLARGTGAQNRIGAEQSDAMGVLLTQEAIAARRLTNVEQYYTRVFDFGFSKTLRETLERWDRPDVISDIVWVLRTFRPDVVIIRYSGTPRDGHGNHQASAVLARKAILAAGDATQFSAQLKHTTPWTPKRILQHGGTGASTVTIVISGKSPHLPKSYAEMASLSRRSFRSQAMGGVMYPASRQVQLTALDDTKEPELLGGIETTWRRFNDGAAIADLVEHVRTSYAEKQPEASVAPLLAVRAKIAALGARSSNPWVVLKLLELDEAIAQCAGLLVLADATPEVVAQNDNVSIVTSVVVRGTVPLELTAVTLRSRLDETPFLTTSLRLARDQAVSHTGTWRVPSAMPFSQPYWLGERDGLVAVVTDQTLIGPAEDRPVLRVHFGFRAGTHEFELSRSVKSSARTSDSGERSVPLVIAPEVTLHPLHRVLIFPNGTARELRITATSHRRASGAVQLDVPHGWQCEPREQKFDFEAGGQTAGFRFTLTPPPGAADDTVLAQAKIDDRALSFDRTVVDYPHIERKTFFPAARVRLVRVPVDIAIKRVGYVMGTGDDVPSCLEQLGCVVTELTAEDLASRDLSGFEAIVLGIRAYNVRPDILKHHSRLRAYVRNGGTLVMQYTVGAGPNAPVDVPQLGPYPFRLSAARVTVEDSPVTFLLADHPVLRAPNVISAADFAGWVQERGLHFASEWDLNYAAPLECHDPEEAPLAGGLLIARDGDGVFIYTAHAWFRQLPAGVPGAYRIFANLLSAGRQ